MIWVLIPPLLLYVVPLKYLDVLVVVERNLSECPNYHITNVYDHQDTFCILLTPGAMTQNRGSPVLTLAPVFFSSGSIVFDTYWSDACCWFKLPEDLRAAAVSEQSHRTTHHHGLYAFLISFIFFFYMS